MEEPKWNLKKEILDEFVQKLKTTVKIMPKSLVYMITFLKKVLNDANINIQISGI